jgi:hypothetical protein
MNFRFKDRKFWSSYGEAPKLGFFFEQWNDKSKHCFEFLEISIFDMKILKRVGLTSEYLRMGFGRAGVALTQLGKSSRVVPL